MVISAQKRIYIIYLRVAEDTPRRQTKMYCSSQQLLSTEGYHVAYTEYLVSTTRQPKPKGINSNNRQ